MNSFCLLRPTQRRGDPGRTICCRTPHAPVPEAVVEEVFILKSTLVPLTDLTDIVYDIIKLLIVNHRRLLLLEPLLLLQVEFYTQRQQIRSHEIDKERVKKKSSDKQICSWTSPLILDLWRHAVIECVLK